MAFLKQEKMLVYLKMQARIKTEVQNRAQV